MQPPSEIITQRVLKKIKPNSVILLHDGDGIRRNSNRSQTALALPLIIKKLKEEGWKFKTIDKLKVGD